MQRRRRHAERTQDVLRDVLVVGLSGHARDDAAEYGKPVVRVLVGDAGRVRERNAAAKHPRQLVLGLGELLIAPWVVFGETLGVRQQMPDRDPRRVRRRVAEALELRNVSLGRIVERQLARIAKLENRHRREALGHRRDAKDRVGVDRRFGLDVAHAHRALVRELAIDDDAPRRAGRVDRRRVVRRGSCRCPRTPSPTSPDGHPETGGWHLARKGATTMAKCAGVGRWVAETAAGRLRRDRGCDGNEDKDCEPLAHGRILQQVVSTHDDRDPQ